MQSKMMCVCAKPLAHARRQEGQADEFEEDRVVTAVIFIHVSNLLCPYVSEDDMYVRAEQLWDWLVFREWLQNRTSLNFTCS